MAKHRNSRINEQLRREITDIVRTQARDPRIGMVTITDVVVATDLGSARVYVSVLGTPDEKKDSIAGLKAAAPFIRSEVAKRMTIRTVPELRFEIDQALEHASRIEELLGSVRKQETAAEADSDAAADGDVDNVDTRTNQTD